MTTEAAAVPKRQMSDDHKAKLAAGRARHYAEKAAKAGLSTTEEFGPAAPADVPKPGEADALRRELEAMRAENATLRKAAGKFTPEEIAKLPTEACYYEFLADKRTDRDEPIGEKISDPDDPRFEELIRLRRPIVGQVIVEKILRAVSGEEIRRTSDAHEGGACIGCKSPQQARDLMRTRLANPADFHIIRDGKK